MKVFQLIFLLGLYLHWVNWFWYFVAKADNDWFPPKDQDSKTTIAYNGHRLDRYILFYYYATLSLVGSELLPTEYIEVVSTILLVFVGAVVVGLTIGEFSAIMESYTARNRAKNEEHDIISTTMLSLRLPEDIQSRVLAYYEELSKGAFINDNKFYNILSPHLSNTIKLFQIKKTMKELSFMDIKNIREVESFASKWSINYYLSGEIILKQGGHNDDFYFIIDGLAEAITETKDFKFFDYKAVHRFITNTIDPKIIEQERLEEEELDRQRKKKDEKDFDDAQIRISHNEAITIADLVPTIMNKKTLYKRTTKKIMPLEEISLDKEIETKRGLKDTDDLRETGNHLLTEYHQSATIQMRK